MSLPLALTLLGAKLAGWQVAGLLVLAVPAAASVAYWLMALASPGRSALSPSLFSELSDAHRLNRRERRVCREAAQAADLADPAEVFVRAGAAGAIAERDAGLARRLLGEG